MRINQDVEHIAMADVHSFVSMTNPKAAVKAVITVNSNTYNISVGTDGKVDVSFRDTGFWRFNWMRGKSLSRMQTAMQTQYDKLVSNYENAMKIGGENDDLGGDGQLKPLVADGNKPKYTSAMLEVQKETDAKIDEKFGPNAAGKHVMLYGHSTVRLTAAERYDSRKMDFSSIDQYNDMCGVNEFTIDAVNLPKMIGKIKSGTLEINEEATDKVPKGNVKKWTEFLQKNASKIDIFEKFRKYEEIAKNRNAHKNATGWAGEFARKGYWPAMLELVKKNIPGGALTTSRYEHKLENRDICVIAQALHNLAYIDAAPLGRGEGEVPHKVKEFKDLSDVLYYCLVDAGKYSEDEANRLADDFAHITNTVISIMFFRQTSKLGLDFCKEQGIPVMFHWTTHEGISLEKSDNEINDKWWKEKGSSIHDHFGASITYSEMRHVQKMEKAQEAEPPADRMKLTKMYGIKV